MKGVNVLGVDNRQLKEFEQNRRRLAEQVPECMEELIKGEGVFAVKEAKRICSSEQISPSTKGSSGNYRNSFHSGDKDSKYEGPAEHDGSQPVRTGNKYTVDVYNNLDYAKHLEYGFRSHFVPGHWEGKTFVYQRNDPAGGMYVGKPGGYIRGRYVLKRAIKNTKDTQAARLRIKQERKIKEFLEKK